MAMSNNINEYVGKTFSYMLGVQNILCMLQDLSLKVTSTLEIAM